MRALAILLQSFKVKCSDYKTLGAITLFPILLTVLFSYVFTNVDKKLNEDTAKPTQVNFKVSIKEKAASTLGEDYLEFLETLNKEQEDLKLTYERDSQYTKSAEVIVDEEKEQILIQGTDPKAQGALEEVSKQFVSTHKLMEVAQAYDKVEAVLEANQKEVGIKAIAIEALGIEDKDKTSMATTIMVTMFIFSILMGSRYGVNQITHMRSNLGKKLLTTPISKGKWYLLEALASFGMILLQAGIFVSFYEGVFNVNLLSHPVQLGFVIGLLSLLAISIGSVIGATIKNAQMAEQFNILAVMGLCFLTGGFTPMVDIHQIGKLSPVTGIAKALFELIEGGSVTNIVGMVLTIVSISLILIGVTYFKIRKEEAV